MRHSDTLKQKTVTGIFWSFMDLVANRGIQFIVQIILARLLAPEHFGLIGMVLILVAISESIVDCGFSQALIRDKHATQVDYSTIFYFNLFIALFLYVLFFTFADVISTFFSEPQITSMIRLTSLVIIINSLGFVQRVRLVKEVDFKTIAKANLIGVLVSGVVTITMAFLGYGVWSLVVNIITLNFVQIALLWLFNRWMPSLVFSKQSFQKYFKFGYKLLLSGLLDTFYNNLFSILIGRFYPTSHLGFYTNALRVSDMASHSVASTVQRVSYPVLSGIQEDEVRLRVGFRKINNLSAFLNFPLMVGLAAIAYPLFMILFGEKWLTSVVYFQLLCFAGMLFPLHTINLNILQVKGRSDLFLLIEVIKKAILTILMVTVFILKLGIIGLIFAAVISSYLSLFVNIYFSGKEINYFIRHQLKDLLPIFIVSLVMGAFVYAMGMIMPFGHLATITCQIILGISVYIFLCKAMKIESLTIFYKMIFTELLKKRWILLKVTFKKL